MTRDESDRQLGRLLAGRDEPSILEREATFDAIMAEVAPPKRRTWWPRLVAMGGAFAVVAAAFVFVPRPNTDPFAARGAPDGSFRVHCVRQEVASDCTADAKLLVQVTAAPERPYFALFAVRADDAAIWYLPAKDEDSPRVALGKETLLTDGFVLDADQHPPGSYVLYGVFSSRALRRADIRAAFDEPPDDIEFVKRNLTIASAVP